MLFDSIGSTLASVIPQFKAFYGVAKIAITAFDIGYKIFDAFTISLEEAKQKLGESRNAFISVSTEIDSINNSLETNRKRIQELLQAENLSYSEKEELERLQSITKELEIQKDLKAKEQLRAATELSEDNKASYKKEYKNQTFDSNNVETMIEKNSNTALGFLYADLDKDESVEGIIATLSILKEKKKDAELAGDSDMYKGIVDIEGDLNQALDEHLSSLLSYQSNLNEISLYRELTEEEEQFNQTLTDGMKLIYEYTDPARWNSIQMKDIFSTEGMDDAKEKLFELANSGEMNEESLRKILPNLDDIIDESNLISVGDHSSIEQFINELFTLAEAQKAVTEMDDSASAIPVPITDAVNIINTQLKPAFDSLKNAYGNIFTEDGFTLENIDISQLADMKSTIDEMGQLGLNVDPSAFESFIAVISDSSSTAGDVQSAFNALTSSLIMASGCTDVSSENFKLLSEQLEELGVTNASEVLTHMKELQEELVESGYDLATITNEEAAAFINSGTASSEALSFLQMYMAQKQLSSQPLNTLEDITALENLCGTLGITGELLSYMTDLRAAYNAIEAGAPPQAYAATIDNIKAKINALTSGGAEFTPATPPKDPPDTNSGAAAGAAAGDAYVEAFDEELSKLDGYKERGKITEKQYLDSLRALNEKYFKDKSKYLEKYQDYEHKYLSGMKSLYESAFGFITKQIDKKIDSVEEQRDAEINSLEEQKEAELNAHQEKIDAIDDEIDRINEANKSRELAIDLQKKQAALAAMENQKTILSYSEGKGMSYVTDTTGIRDSREELEAAKENIRINQLEQERNLIEDMKKNSENYWDNLINQTNLYYDSVIQGLEAYKLKYEELMDVFEQTQMEVSLSQLGVSLSDILNGSDSAFETLKNSYLGILTEMNSDTFSGLTTSLGDVQTQTQATVKSLVGGGKASSDEEKDSQEEDTDSSSLKGAILEQGEVASKVFPQEQQEMALVTNEAQLATGEIDNICTALDNLDGREINVKINVESPFSILQNDNTTTSDSEFTKPGKGNTKKESENGLLKKSNTIAPGKGENIPLESSLDPYLPVYTPENLTTFVNPATTSFPLPNSLNNITPLTQDIRIDIGDIHLQNVQDAEGLSNAIITRLPNALLQGIHQR